MIRQKRASTVLLAVFGFALLAGAAAADTIYLKNGRVIRTSSATVEGQRVLFLQYGHPFAIPLSQVERVVEDDARGPAATPARPPATAAAAAAGAVVGGGLDVPMAAVREDPEQTREYWQDRVRTMQSQSEALDLELKQLRRVERAFLFSHRSTADTRRQIEDVQARIAANERAMPQLRREARAKGIPAGWLRLPSGG